MDAHEKIEIKEIDRQRKHFELLLCEHCGQMDSYAFARLFEELLALKKKRAKLKKQLTLYGD